MVSTTELPSRILTSWNAITKLPSEAGKLGTRIFMVHSERLSGSMVLEDILRSFSKEGLSVYSQRVRSGEPTVDQVEQILQRLENSGANVVVGIGGGSILDISKAIAGLCFENRLSVMDYFKGSKISKKGLPWIAVPTTAGTGAEATPNSVLSDGVDLKQSIRGDRNWLATCIIADPALTVTCNAKVTAWSGLDALTQAVESYTSIGSNALSEPYSLSASQLIGRSLQIAYKEPDNERARTDMLYGSLLAGIALANARLGVVHGLAHPIGLRYNLPHGLVCGVLLPWAISYNMEECSGKYATLAKACGVGDTANDLYNWVCKLNDHLQVPRRMGSLGLLRRDFEWIIERSMPSGSLKANPKRVTKEDLYEMLEKNL